MIVRTAMVVDMGNGMKSQPYSEMGICNTRCKSCKYHGLVGSMATCEYIVHTGQIRPCPAGKHCTEYSKGKALGDANRAIKMRNNMHFRKIKCARCQQEIVVMNNHKYCNECAYIVRKEKDRRQAKERYERYKERKLLEDRICVHCGAVFHSDNRRRRYCDDCLALPASKRREA